MAYGAVLVGHLQTSAHNARVRPYIVDAGDATAIFLGDFVKTDGTNGAESIQGNSGITQTFGAVIRAAAGDVIRGVVVGVDPVVGVSDPTTTLGVMYRLASTQRVLWVCDDPYALFMIQSDSAIALSQVGENANFVSHSGSTFTGLSGNTISATTTTSSANLRIMGVDNTITNVPDSATTNMIVLINTHELKSLTAE